VQCPKCKTDQAHRSHRRDVKERLAALFAIYPYRCHGCEYRFLRFRYASPEAIVSGHAPVEREIRATRAALEWKRKRRELLLYGVGFLLFLAFLYFITRERNSPGE
jgi:hypothetical protein